MWQFVFIIDEFRTTGPKRRADNGQEIGSLNRKILLHAINGFGDDVGHCPPPAIVNGSNNTLDRIMQKYCLAIGLLDEKADSSYIGNHGIISRQVCCLVNAFHSQY